MSKLRLPVLAIVILLVTVAAVLTSCGPQTEFEKVEVVTQAPVVTEPYVPVYSEMEVFGTKMGMTPDEARQALNLEEMVVSVSDSGIVSYVSNETGLDFVTPGMESSVYYLFTRLDGRDEDVRLCEIQYASNNDTGFVLSEAIEKFDNLYGGHCSLEESEKTNYVWYNGGNYIIATAFADGQNAISYFSKEYFELSKPELAKLYKEQVQEV